MQSYALIAQKQGDDLVAGTVTQKRLEDDEVLVRIWYCGMCHSDVHHLRNEWSTSLYPMVPGHEIVGVVQECGSRVVSKIGDIVGVGTFVRTCTACERCTSNKEQYCDRVVWTYDCRDWDGTLRNGGYGTHITVGSKYVVDIPEFHFANLARVAPLLCAGVTVYAPMAPMLRFKKPQRVLVVGLGGLGHLAVRLAVAWGHDVHVKTRNRSKDEWITRNGAKVMTSHSTFDVAIDTVSARHELYLSSINVGGTYIMLGLPGDPPLYDHFAIVCKAIKLTGSIVGSMEDLKGVLRSGILADVVEVEPDAQSVREAIDTMDTVQFRHVINFKKYM